MIQHSGSPAPDFKDLAPTIEELEVQLALSLLKLQVVGAMKGTTEIATKKMYTQAILQMMMTPTAPQTSTSSGNSWDKPSSNGDKTQAGQKEWDNMGWTSSWSMPHQDQKPWTTSANTWSTRSQHSLGHSRHGKMNSHHKKDHQWAEPSWKMSEDSHSGVVLLMAKPTNCDFSAITS
jgi:hypothetical protein